MRYQALYREWRPQNFDCLVGQNHVVTTLKNAVKTGKIAHAYLFSGPRGTGKTSAAKVLAKSLNCHQGPTEYPCEQCVSCQEHSQGRFMDLIEIDAASNRGIDEIRQIRENVVYTPTEGRYKIYIVDEVHMLTTEAFNALLKTLEEPPSHVIFVLATTEPHKLPMTILSRCQRFDFHKIPMHIIEEQVKKVLENKQIDYEDTAVGVIAQKSDGSLRDALSLLDQSLSFIGENEKLKETHIYEIIGAVPGKVYRKLLEGIYQNRLEEVIQIVQEASERGKDMGQFLNDFILFIRDLLLLKLDQTEDQANINMEPSNKEMLQGSFQDLAGLKNYFNQTQLLSMIDFLAEQLNNMKWTQNQRLIVEMSIMRLLHELNGEPVSSEDPRDSDQIESKDMKNQADNSTHPGELDSVERRRGNEEAIQSNKAPQFSQTEGDKKETGGDERGETGKTRQAEAAFNFEEIKEQWPSILEKLKEKKITAHALVKEGRPHTLKGSTLYLGFSPTYSIHKEWVEQKELQTLKSALNEFFPGLNIKCQLMTQDEAATQNNRGKNNKTEAQENLKEGAIEEFGADKVETFNPTRRDS